MNTDQLPGASRSVARQDWRPGELRAGRDEVAQETPVAMVYNGVSHVVMMATPVDLEDFALGFSLSEGILDRREDLLGVDVEAQPAGLELRMEISSACFARLRERRRNLAGRTGCGLCGAESLAQALPPPRRVDADLRVARSALQRAAVELAAHQSLKSRTGSVHGAAYCSLRGEPQLVREDVGRHNALDKLLGALARMDLAPEGFVLVTSRASYEMVAKTASANIPLLAAVSAPTTLAIDYAEAANITLLGHLSEARHVAYTWPHRITGEPD